MTARSQGLLCAIGVLLIWAGFLLTSRLSQAQAFTPWDVAALRYTGAFLAALPLLAWRGPPRIPLGRALVLTLLAGFIFPIGAYWGFHFAPAAHGAVLLPGLLPFLSAALWWWAFGEAWGWRRFLSLGLVALGIGLLAGDTFAAHPGAWRGDLLFILGCASWAIYMVLVRRWGASALDVTLAIALLAAPIYLPLWWLVLPSNIGAVPGAAILFHTLYQGTLSVIVAGFLFTRAVVLLGGPQTSAVTAVVPALVALGAWPLLGETLDLMGWAGVLVVTLGMVAGVAPSRDARKA
ncbi:DMT family transporter [Sediminicoccus sp. KRV36]|uniref:DMT family transporter n=1 Tax=Sediminicoccus sp. KRV36 TaxID=3133721 RepID=UPI00200DB926|nr:DMT family transporter [Sediminicoccus rosea]UPY37798.1 DMT family transporter [Sediminicoccus rosea]